MMSARVNVFGSGHSIRSPRALAQAAVVDQQVAHLHLARDPRVVHAELRQLFDHRVVPAQLAGIDQSREHAGGHGLGVGGDLEQRVASRSARRCPPRARRAVRV